MADVGADEVPGSAAVEPGHLHVVPPPDGDGLGPHLPGHRGPGEGGNDPDQVPGALPQKGPDDDHDRELGDSQKHLDQKGDQSVRPAPRKARQYPQAAPHRKGEGGGGQADAQATEEAGGDLGVDVHPQVVGAEPVGGGGGLQGAPRRELGRVGVSGDPPQETEGQQRQQEQGNQPFASHGPSSSPSSRRLTTSAAARLRSTSTADRRNTPWSMG